MWKNDQKDRRVKRNLKLAAVALFILGLLIFAGKIFQIYSDFQKPFYTLNSQKREISWTGSYILNLIIAKSEKIHGSVNLSQLNLVSLDPDEGKLIIIKLSDEILADVPKDFGSWKLGSVYKLGQEDNPKIGEDLLKMSISKIFALPIDGIIEVSGEDDLDVEVLISKWKSNPLAGFKFLTMIQTDLSLKEAMDFVSKTSKVRPDKITSLDLFRSSITKSQLLPDSSRVLGVDGVKLDTFVKENLKDPNISGEDLAVGVFNGTDHPGLTSEVVRLVTNLGGSVTIISNTSEKFVKNGIYINLKEGSDALSSRTYERLAGIFAPHCLKIECVTGDLEIKNSRSAINIVLGEEYFNYWSLR